MAKVGMSNPDRTISLEGCSAYVENNNNNNNNKLLLSLGICSLTVDNTVSCKQICVLPSTRVTTVASVWELQTHTSVGV